MIEDVDGNRFLDWIGGVGVLNIGYTILKSSRPSRPRPTNTSTACSTSSPTRAMWPWPKLAQIVPVQGDKKKVFFANSGAEADENAVKIARAYTKRPNIITFSGAFHGRTMLTMTMTAKKAYTTSMGPWPPASTGPSSPYLYRNPSDMTEDEAIEYYIQSIRDVFEEATPADQVAAIVVEPSRARGGFIPAPHSLGEGPAEDLRRQRHPAGGR